MKLALIEFIDEFRAFEAFLAKKGFAVKDFVIIALEPRIQAYLRKRGVPYQTTLPYFSNESHKRMLVESEKIMVHLRTRFTFTDDNGLRSSYATELTHHVRLYVNHMLKMLEIIENACQKHPIEELYAWVGQERSAGGMIDDTERYAGALARRYAEQRGLRFCNTREGGSARSSRSSDSGSRIFARIATRLLLLLLRRRKAVFVPVGGGTFKSLLEQLAKMDQRIVFLAIGSTSGTFKITAFNILSFFRSLSRTRRFPYFLIETDRIYPAAPGELARLMTHLDETMNTAMLLFAYNSIDYGELVRAKVEAGLKPHLAAMLSWSHALRHLFSSFPDRIVLSFLALGIMSLAGDLSKKMGFTSLFVSHGAHPVPVDAYHEIELVNLCRGFMLSEYSHVALSTPVQEAHLHYFKQTYPWVRNTEVRTGPLIFADIGEADKNEAKKRLGIAPDDIVLTHATTTKARHGERYYFLETFDELFASLSDIIESLEGNMKLIVRIHPGFYLTDEEIRTLLPASDRFIINRQGSFGDVLAATDVLVSYSSTTIDEALINRVPVLLYDPWDRYNHFGTSPFPGQAAGDILPVCYVNKKTSLQEAICAIMSQLRAARVESIDFSRYRYSEEHRTAFFNFVVTALESRI